MLPHELLAQHKQGEIKNGDTVDLEGFFHPGYIRYHIPAPYYFSKYEQYAYRVPESYTHHYNNGRCRYENVYGKECLRDEIGCYENELHFIYGDNNREQATDPYQVKQNGIHLIGSAPLSDFIDFCYSDESIIATLKDRIEITGKVYQPLNYEHSRCQVGITNISRLWVITPDEDGKDYVHKLNLAVYDTRPKIDLTILPRKFHDAIMREILEQTKMKVEDFCWVFERMGVEYDPEPELATGASAPSE